MKLYVGNLAFSVTDSQLQAMFAEHGNVESAKVVRDQNSGQARGFGFVEMPDGEAQKAMALLNGKEFEGRALTVNEARPMKQNSGRQGGNGRGNGSFHRRSY